MNTLVLSAVFVIGLGVGAFVGALIFYDNERNSKLETQFRIGEEQQRDAR